MKRKKPSNRREFLQGRTAAEALRNAVDSALPAESPVSTTANLYRGADQSTTGGVHAPCSLLPAPRSSPQTYLVRIGRRAMACEFEVLLNAGQYGKGTESAVAVLDLVERLESQLTVYRDTSEVSRLNRTACRGPVEIEPRLFALLQLAAAIHVRSGGAYDITSGPLTKAWGFYRRAGRIPNDEELACARACVGSGRLQLDADRRTLQMPVGMEINLGSIGKGYSLDRAAELLEDAGVGDFLLHGGQSSVLARGARNPAAGEGWTVGVRHPLRPGQRIGEIRLRNRALGTSGAGTQFFFHEGRRLGHILDPRTGRPAEGTLSATVLARTAAEADALSTAFYVLGPTEAVEYCRRHGAAHGGLAAVLLAPGSRPGAVEAVTFGLADGDWLLDESRQ